MAALSRSKSKAQYSWWWDSHISPKNSKWLKENLTDMDSKVKTMIKLIEVDEDSFVRRAEVYFRRRPELMKLVEEFYRAYRALAERYDHATGVIRHAHQTMSEAFPDQIPSLMSDDSDPHTPEMQASVNPDESSDFSSAKANGEVETLAGRKVFSKQLNGLERARKGLNFHVVEREAGEGMKKNDLQALKDALAKLEAEKEAGLLQYKQALERLSKLESEVSQAKEDSRGFNERASTAEAEVESLKETLVRVESEREASLLQYQQCLSRISNLESHISRVEEDTGQLTERASKAEKETEILKEELAQVKAKKEALLGKYLESLEKIANLENKLLLAEDYASRTSERAERAEKQVESLKETIERLTEEKEAAIHKYEECLEKIAALEREIAIIQEEAERLRAKVGVQDQELSEKQKELGKLWTCVQEERMRFMEAENAFQSLQNMHAKVQEELRSVATELQKKVEILKDMEIQNQHLQDEVQKAVDENKSLNELNLSSAVTIKSMQDNIFGLKDHKGKLEQELELRVDEKNALQQEIYSLKEELNDLTQRHQDVEDENSNLKESSERNEAEIAALVEKLGVMEKLIEKNELLENSLADLQTELEGAREKVKALEESCQLLMGEKSMLASDKATLISQLQITTENLEKLSERNSFLENSLFDVNAELEMLRVKSKNLEDSCRLLNDQNSVLVTEKQTLASQLEMTQHKLEDLGKRHADLEQRYTGLEEEREFTLRRVEELQGCLEVEKQEHSNSTQLNQTKIANLESQICVLQEVGEHMREEFEEELDKAVNAQFDIFILRKSIHDLRDKNTSLMGYCEKLQEASKLSEKLISELENTSYEQKEELRVLSGEIKGLRKGMFQLLEALHSDATPEDIGYDNEDKRILHYILGKLDDIKTSLCEALDDNHALVIEKSVLLAVLWQLKKDVEDLNDVIIFLRQEIEIRNNQILILQKEMQTLFESNEELILKVREGNQKEVALLTEMESLRQKLFNLQGAYEDLKQEKHVLEDECSCIVGEAVALDNLSFMLKNIISEKAREFIELNENYDKLGYANGVLVERVRITETKLEEILAKNIGLEVLLKEAENELSELRVANDQFKDEVANGKDSLCLKEMELSEAEERVRALSSELQKGKDAVELWETVAWAFFSELQSANVRETLIKEKLYELMREYALLKEENCSKGTDIVELHERVGVLEGENSEIKARLAADLSAILSLRDSVASLEKHTGLQRKLHETDDEEKEDDQPYYKLSEDKVAAGAVLGGHVDLHDVHGRIQAVEKAVIELKQHAEERYSSLLSDLDSTTRQIHALKSQTLSRHGSKRFSKRFGSNPEEGPSNGLIIDVPERGDELLMKDIVLDQVSDPSSDGKKNSRRKMVSDDQTLELWETVDQGGSIDLSVGKPEKEKDNMSSRRPSSELTVEKELLWVNDEQQESSKRFPQPHQGEDDNKRKFLERLASDVQKLTNIQITVQDLKEKLDITDNFSTKEKSAERYGIKDQLVETEKTILQLFDYGGKLMKKIENSTSFNATSSIDSISGGGSGRRRRFSEQAQRMSEKIGRLQLEVQRIQFFLMKLDNNKVGGKSGARAPEGNTRVLLRDYLYGRGPRTPRRRLKTRFCACVRPSAMDD